MQPATVDRKTAEPQSPQACRVSVVIKALNEERNISRAIDSALVALLPVGGEVVVADSHSTDGTVDVARRYPVQIARLTNASERCCGIGPQMGYQMARGDFVYLMDGDMRLHPDFLNLAVAFLAQNPKCAGVGGQVVEKNTTSLEFQARVARGHAHMQWGPVDRLDGGGLFRRSAVEAVGYFSDRNLHSYEELDLALRLAAAGWTLHRLAAPAVDHFGHDVPALVLLKRRWTSRYADGLGELLRAAPDLRRLGAVFRAARELRIYLAWLTWLTAGLALATWGTTSLAWSALLALAVVAIPWSVLALRKRSVVKAAYSLASWTVLAVAMLRGLARRRIDPRTPVKFTRIDGAPTQSA